MFLIDTDVISELRRADLANSGVRQFFLQAARDNTSLYLSAVTIGELRQGVEKIRHRGDHNQAQRLEQWLLRIALEYTDSILPFDADAAQIWGHLRVPNAEYPLDKQIAATALIHGLTVVTRNTSHFAPTGAQVLNPFR